MSRTARQALIASGSIAISFFLLVSCPAAAQIELSEAEARRQIERQILRDCVPIPVGRWKLTPGENVLHRRLLGHIGAIVRIGVAVADDETSEPRTRLTADQVLGKQHASGGITINVSLSTGVVDASQVRADAKPPCLAAPRFEFQQVERIERGRGGLRHDWDAAIVTYTYLAADVPSLYAAYVDALPAEYRVVGPNRRGRSLFRYDPSSTEWRHLASDYAAAAESEFRTNFVALQLQSN